MTMKKLHVFAVALFFMLLGIGLSYFYAQMQWSKASRLMDEKLVMLNQMNQELRQQVEVLSAENAQLKDQVEQKQRNADLLFK